MIERREAESGPSRVHELEGQVTAFTDLGEAIRAIDDVLGQASVGLVGAGGPHSPDTARARRHEVRTVRLV